MRQRLEAQLDACKLELRTAKKEGQAQLEAAVAQMLKGNVESSQAQKLLRDQLTEAQSQIGALQVGAPPYPWARQTHALGGFVCENAPRCDMFKSCMHIISPSHVSCGGIVRENETGVISPNHAVCGVRGGAGGGAGGGG